MAIAPLIKQPAELAKTSFAVTKGQLFKSLKKAAKKHNTRETAMPFFMQLDAKYSDTNEGLLLIFGKMGAWKKYAKDTAPKAEALRGFCFVSEDPETGGFVLNLMPVAGKFKAKINALSKEVKKVIPPSKLQVEIVPGEFKDDDPELAKLEAAADNAADDEGEEAEAPSASAEAQVAEAKIPAAIGAGLKALAGDLAQVKAAKGNPLALRQVLQGIRAKVAGVEKGLAGLPAEVAAQVTGNQVFAAAKKLMDGAAKPAEAAPAAAAPAGPDKAKLKEFRRLMAQMKQTYAGLGVTYKETKPQA